MSASRKECAVSPSSFQRYAKNVRDAGSALLSALLSIPPEAAARRVAVQATAPRTANGDGHEVSLLRLYYMARGKDSLSTTLAHELQEVALHVAH